MEPKPGPSKESIHYGRLDNSEDLLRLINDLQSDEEIDFDVNVLEDDEIEDEAEEDDNEDRANLDMLVEEELFLNRDDLPGEDPHDDNLELPQQNQNIGQTAGEWSSANNVNKFPFTKKNEFLGANLLAGNEPIDFFKLYFTDNFLEMIVREMNDYAETLFLSAGVSDKSRITDWKPVTIEELRVFFGLLLHTGTIKAARLTDYWKKGPLFNLGFGSYMGRNRYFLLMRCLHFKKNPGPNDPPPLDRLYKVRPVIDHFNETTKNLYYPSRNLCIDESVMLWRGRLLFRVYIKNKHHKYGVKFYLLTEPNGFILRTILYSGKSDALGGVGHGEKVVMALMNDFFNSGHSLFMDNYYNSVGLATKLIDLNTNCTGTLRQDRKDIPCVVKNKVLKKGEIIERFNEKGVCVGKWKDRRPVMMISTETTMEKCDVATKFGVTVEKPKSVKLYNKFMSGIDLQDQLQAYYSCEKKTMRWYKKVAIHIILQMLMNSYLLYNKYSQNKLSLYDYRLRVIYSLIGDPKTVQRPLGRGEQHELTKIAKRNSRGEASRKRCSLCAKNKKRTDTTFECKMCPNQPGYCVECFFKAHKCSLA